MGLVDSIPTVIPRLTLLSGLLGIITGVLISYRNDDDLGWSLLRVASLAVIFAFAARCVLTGFLRAWMESRIETLTQQHEAAQAASAAAAKKVK
jgi:hypothetical protein